jgi:orotate phosphoribosyltransferase-like protein
MKNKNQIYAKVVELIKQGMGRCRIAKELGIPASTASRLIVKARNEHSDLPPIDRQESTTKSNEEKMFIFDRVQELHSQGMGCYKIASELGITPNSASYWIRKVNNGERSGTWVDKVRIDLDSANLDTYEMAKKYQKTPNSINTLVRKAESTFNPARDWVIKAAKTGVKLSYLKEHLKVKNKDRAIDVIKEAFPDCFVVETQVGDDVVLTPVYDSKNEVESINVDTSKKPFNYFMSPAGNYLLINIDDNYGDDRLILPGISDVHVGSVHHRPELFQKIVDWIAATNGMIPILNGDLCENITKQSVGGLMEQYLSPNNQVTSVCKTLAPIAHLVPVSVTGNHEERTERFSDYDMGAVIAQLLKVPYSKNSVTMDIHWRGIKKRIFVTHRHGKSYSIAAVEASVMKNRQFMGHMDAYFSGHNHKSFILPEETVEIVEGRGFEHKRWHILNNGSCVGRTGGYAENFPPAPQDLVYLEIFEDGSQDAKSLPIISI